MGKSFIAVTTSLLEVIAGVMLALMMVLTFIDVVGRYAISVPVFGATEMIQFLMAMVIFSGLAIANANDDHIVVELFDQRLAKVAPRAYAFVIQAFSIATMAMIVYVLAMITKESLSHDAKTIVLELPLGYVQAAVTALASISLLVQVARLIVGKSPLAQQGTHS